jgi:trehalose 6-phosphate phosphatase
MTMKPLFSDAGRRRLDAIVQRRVLCAFDFDGTLAPIVVRPEHARLPHDIMTHLVALSQHAPVAIITGRSVDDIRGRLGFVPDFIVGNHGVEGVPGWESHAARHQALSASWMTQLSGALQNGAHDAGVEIEDKRYSLSVHYRMADDPERSARALRQVFSHMEPAPRVVAGKYVFNLVPHDAAHKGNALERLMAITGAQSAVYVGDDVTDEDVFRLTRQNLLSIRIEQATDSAAPFFLERPGDILALLQDLTARLQAADARNWMRGAATPVG